MMTDGTRPVRVLCSGILVSDIFVPPMAALPVAGQLRATDDFLLETGGCAANVATGLARLDIGAAVVGRVGSDVFGDFVIQALADRGLDTSGIRRSARLGTSKTVILTVTGEDRRFIHTFGANAEFSAADVTLDGLAGGDVLYLGGFLIMPDLESIAVADLFRSARARGIITVLDVVVPAGAESGAMRLLTDILPSTDYFMPNDEEGRALTGESDPRKQAAAFLDAGCGAAIITQGKSGTLFLSDGMHCEAGVYKVEFVDGSGSGDAFAAGFITGLIEKWELPRTLQFASAVGASACTRLGCTPGVFTRAEAEEYMRGNSLRLTVLPASRA